MHWEVHCVVSPVTCCVGSQTWPRLASTMGMPWECGQSALVSLSRGFYKATSTGPLQSGPWPCCGSSRGSSVPGPPQYPLTPHTLVARARNTHSR